ncbi:MAG TPA: hypothetical protein VMM38_08945 [Aridibacter sp.]|nr:hypothetical protein [Aridibacter sp.]
MTYYKDLSKRCMAASGWHVRAIGWLDEAHRFRKGRTSEEFREKLRAFAEKASISMDTLGWGYYFGLHTCELCEEYESGLNFGVPAGRLLYVAPEMVSHYVDRHRYRPPKKFINAVLASPLPGSREYSAEVARFRELQNETRRNEAEGGDSPSDGPSREKTSTGTKPKGFWERILRTVFRK